MDLIRSISWISSSHLRLVRDDDSHVDRLSHRYTVAICVLFAIIVSTKQYAGDPIDCWVPAQFKASYEKYADSYCWIAGSWYTPMDKELPLNERERRNQRIRYYQWVPFLLLFQAILCYIPRIIWRSFNVRSGLDLVNLIDAAIKYESVDKFSDREKIMAYIVRNIERYIGARKNLYERLYGREFCITHNPKIGNESSGMKQSSLGSNRNRSRDKNKSCCNNCGTKLRFILSTICFWTGKRLGNYLVVLYMFVKTLWLTNAVSQLFLLNRFIGNDYHAFGIEIIEMLLSGQEWHELRHFPRVTYCDFKIREIGNSHDWTVQCVLRINLFNEVIYIFMWFWLCILALCSLVDYFTWIFRILIPADKVRFIKRHLDIYNYYLPKSQEIKQQKYKNTSKPSNNFEYIDPEKEKKLIKEFTFNYLKDDGIFAMRILASSASDLIVTEIISELWRNFKNSISESMVDETMIVTSPSSSSSASTSQGSSAASTPVQQQENSKRHTNQQSSPSQLNQSSPYSPTNFIKKPLNHSGNNIKVQYSPTSQHQQNINSIYSNLSLLTKHNQLNVDNNNNTEFNQPPPVPNTIMPHLTFNNPTNNLIDEDKKNPMTEKDIFPNLQQTQITQQLSQHLQNTNINPNSKDTHV